MLRQKVKYVSVVLAVLFVLAACQTPVVNVRNNDGETTPRPFYRVEATGKSKLQFTWFYVAYTGVKDIDGSVQTVPIYLDPRDQYLTIDKKTVKVSMVMRAFNPLKEKYSVYMNRTTNYRFGKDVRAYEGVGKSNMEFREWHFACPIGKDLVKHKMFIEVYKEGNVIVRTLPFKYSKMDM